MQLFVVEATLRQVIINLFDKDVIDLNLLAAILSGRNYEVKVFDRAAICPVSSDQTDTCPNSSPCSDIILADNQMPEMTGSDMFRLQAQRKCPIDIRNKAVASANIEIDEKKRIEGSGFVFFSKPFQFNVLFSWLDECKERIDLSKPAGIMRRHPRYSTNIDVMYTYSSDEKLQKGTILNFSNGGLCLKANDRLVEKQSIRIKTELPNGCSKASVRWVKKAGGEFYLAGLMAL